MYYYQRYSHTKPDSMLRKTEQSEHVWVREHQRKYRTECSRLNPVTGAFRTVNQKMRRIKGSE